jgi:hypothetical protein
MFFCSTEAGRDTKCPIAIADLVLLYNQCMEGQYGKGDFISFDLYKSYPQLKGAILKVLQSVRDPASLFGFNLLRSSIE